MNFCIKTIFILLCMSTFVYAQIIIGFAGASVNKPSKEILIELDKIKDIAQQNGIKVSFKQLPWKRALLLLEKGKIDGAINASYKPDRAVYALYPMHEGQLDFQKRLNDGSSYFIYRQIGTPSIWDGKKFLQDNLKIGVMEEFAVIEDLKKHNNIQIKEFVKNNDIVRQLLNKQLDGYASSKRYMEGLLETYPNLQNKFVKDSEPIRKKEYYLIFSKLMYKIKSNEMEKLWEGLQQYNEK